MRIVVVQEQIENESRVASTPDVVEELVNQGNEVCVQSSAGVLAGFDDEEYVKAGATIAPDTSTAIEEEAVSDTHHRAHETLRYGGWRHLH